MSPRYLPPMAPCDDRSAAVLVPIRWHAGATVRIRYTPEKPHVRRFSASCTPRRTAGRAAARRGGAADDRRAARRQPRRCRSRRSTARWPATAWCCCCCRRTSNGRAVDRRSASRRHRRDHPADGEGANRHARARRRASRARAPSSCRPSAAIMRALLKPLPESSERSIDIDARVRRLQELVDRALSLATGLSPDIKTLVMSLDDPLRIAYLLASLLDMKAGGQAAAARGEQPRRQARRGLDGAVARDRGARAEGARSSRRRKRR